MGGGWVGGWGDSNLWFLKPPRSSRLNPPRFTAFGFLPLAFRGVESKFILGCGSSRGNPITCDYFAIEGSIVYSVPRSER